MNIDDPLLEIRKAREEHAAKFHYNLAEICQDIRREEQKLKAEGWKVVNLEKKVPGFHSSVPLI